MTEVHACRRGTILQTEPIGMDMVADSESSDRWRTKCETV